MQLSLHTSAQVFTIVTSLISLKCAINMTRAPIVTSSPIFRNSGLGVPITRRIRSKRARQSSHPSIGVTGTGVWLPLGQPLQLTETGDSSGCPGQSHFRTTDCQYSCHVLATHRFIIHSSSRFRLKRILKSEPATAFEPRDIGYLILGRQEPSCTLDQCCYQVQVCTSWQLRRALHRHYIYVGMEHYETNAANRDIGNLYF